jgi:hypothetical protein
MILTSTSKAECEWAAKKCVNVQRKLCLQKVSEPCKVVQADSLLARIRGRMKQVSDGVFAVFYIHGIIC